MLLSFRVADHGSIRAAIDVMRLELPRGLRKIRQDFIHPCHSQRHGSLMRCGGRPHRPISGHAEMLCK